jgi:uncharacterized membrane protein YphA (DoxX/SURF4 family)
MKPLLNIGNSLVDMLDKTRAVDFLAPLMLRLFVAPIFIMAGYKKLSGLENTAYYFGEYLGLPAPMLMAVLAGATEFIGGIAFLLGFAVRIFAIPLMFTMFIAATTAHWENGWHILPETTLTSPWEWREDLIDEAVVRKEKAKEILSQHGRISWLTSAGPVTILKNGIELAATYFIMCLALLFLGGGRFVSIDYWLGRSFRQTD